MPRSFWRDDRDAVSIQLDGLMDEPILLPENISGFDLKAVNKLLFEASRSGTKLSREDFEFIENFDVYNNDKIIEALGSGSGSGSGVDYRNK